MGTRREGAQVRRSIDAMLADLPVLEREGPTDADVTSVAYASDEVTPGAAFVAIRERAHDGHRFIADARMADSRRALGTISATFYWCPSARMEVIGVTGTGGETRPLPTLEAPDGGCRRDSGGRSAITRPPSRRRAEERPGKRYPARKSGVVAGEIDAATVAVRLNQAQFGVR